MATVLGVAVPLQMPGDASLPHLAPIYGLRALAGVCRSSIKASKHRCRCGLECALGSATWPLHPPGRRQRIEVPRARGASRERGAGVEGARGPGGPRCSPAEHQESQVSAAGVAGGFGPELGDGLGSYILVFNT